MRILFVNKYLYAKGGSETHLLGLAEALGLRDHAIEFFGTEHPDNVTPPDKTVTIPGAHYGELRGWADRFQAVRDMLFSATAYTRLQQHLLRSRVDIAHLHNIYHQISPSVLLALRESNVPCVLTAHDYKLVCPSYSLHDGESQCFACCGHRYWNVVVRGCSRKGRAGDLALVLEAYVHNFLRVYARNISLIIAPSRYVRDRLVQGGYSAQQVRVLPNAVPVAQYKAQSKPGDYLLFVGRLSYEKGLQTLLEAAQCVPDVPVWIVGDGPLRESLERQAAALSNVRLLGRRSPHHVRSLLEGCRALVLSSEVPENCPLSVLEAFASGKPVIATRVGGVPELFEDATGLIVPPRDPAALAAAMQQLWKDADLCRHCGIQARRRAESHHDLQIYARVLEEIYESLVNHGAADTIAHGSHEAARSEVGLFRRAAPQQRRGA